MFGWNNGYNYKNIAANGGFFLLTSQLARYTGNQTYVDWAEKTWNWFTSSTLVSVQGDVYKIYDGAGIQGNCKKPNPSPYSYNYGMTLAGLAYMYNHVCGSLL